MRKIILGTDWWSDCDDAVALRLIANAHKDKKIELIGVGINACMDRSVASMRGFLSADGLGDVPIGLDRTAVGYEGRHLALYQKRLAETFAPDITNDCAEDAMLLYRRLLAESEEPLEIIEIGFLGILCDLLKSTPDDLSPMTGVDLIRSKVKKIWVMAGKWDGDGEREHNIALNEHTRRAAHGFLELCPVPVTFLGFETGVGILTGDRLSPDDHLYLVMKDYGAEHGRHSWDPMLALMAIIGNENTAGYAAVEGFASVDIDTGANHFEKCTGGPHKYVIKNREDGYYKDLINTNLIIKKG